MFARILGLVVLVVVSWANPVDPIWTSTIEDEDGSSFKSACAIRDTAFVLLGHKWMPNTFAPDTAVVQLFTRDRGLIWTQMYPVSNDYPSQVVFHNNEIWFARSRLYSWTSITRISLTGEQIGAPIVDSLENVYGQSLYSFGSMPVVRLRSFFSDSTGHLRRTEISFLDGAGLPGHTVYYNWNATHTIHDVIETDGGYLVLGHSYDTGGDPFWMKIDGNGDSLWSRTHHIEGSTNFIANIIRLADGSYYAVGTGTVPGRGNQGLLLKIDSQGDTVWMKNFGGQSVDYFSEIVRTDSGFTLIGDYWHPNRTHSDTWMLFVNENGDSLGQFIDDADNNQQQVSNVIVIDSLMLLYGGRHNPTLNRYVADATLWVKAQSVGAASELPSPTSFALHSPYPNPFNATTTIEFELPRSSDVVLNVYDVQGRLVTTLLDDVASAGVHSVNWSCSECASGLYFVRMAAGEFVGVQKILLVK